MNPRVWLSVLSLSFLWLCSRATDQTGAASVSSKNPVDEISSGETVALVGTITAAAAWGAPNFGETPEQDKKESYFVLSTSRPIRMKDTDGSQLPDTVKVQLILSGASGELPSKIKKYAGGTSVKVTGKAYLAATGHHHESIVLDLETVEKAAGSSLAVSSGDKVFFRELKSAVLNDDRGKFAGLVLYPITVHVDEKDITLTSAADGVSHYSQIVTEKVKASITAQEIDNLTKSWRGIMVGAGEVWFDRIKRPDDREFVYRIVGFNP